MIELYHAGLTACSKKVRLCLREKRLSYVSRFIDLAAFEQHDPAYLALNPNGLVPTLVHDGFVVYESTIINEYLEEAFPENPLAPADPRSKARMRLWGKRADEALAPNLVFAFAIPGGIGDSAQKLSDEELRTKIEKVPLLERRTAIEKAARGGFKTDEKAAARDKAEQIIGQIESELERGPYLAGEQYSLADINMVPFVHRFRERVIPDRFTDAAYPLASAWLSQVMSRQAVIETFRASAETSKSGTMQH